MVFSHNGYILTTSLPPYPKTENYNCRKMSVIRLGSECLGCPIVQFISNTQSFRTKPSSEFYTSVQRNYWSIMDSLRPCVIPSISASVDGIDSCIRIDLLWKLIFNFQRYIPNGVFFCHFGLYSKIVLS